MDLLHLLGIVIFLGLIWASVTLQLPIILWTILLGLGLVVLKATDLLSFTALVIFGLPYIIAAGFANLKQYRLKYVTQPALQLLKKQMPPISETEREALEAGHTWWEKELFSGKPIWRHLFSVPKPTLTTEEQSFLDNQVEQLCSMLNDWEIVQNHDLPPDVWSYLKSERFFGLIIPKEYGGRGFSAVAQSTVITKIATRSMSAAVNTMVPNTLGPGELLMHYGTEEQKAYYLPRLAQGIEMPCFALTAPRAGSDASAIPDTGIVCHGEINGKQVVGLRLNWDKRYITLAPTATLLGLAIHMYDPDHILSDKEDRGITLCLIPTNHPGVDIGTRHLPLTLAFLNGPTRGKDVFIPLDWIIGGLQNAGKGWNMLMECLSAGRAISLPALATATGKVVYRYTGAYARLRQQFNVPISAFEGIEEQLGYVAGHTYVLEACRLMTAGAVDLGVKPAIASAIAKYHMTELSRSIVERAMDVHAGHMIQMGPRNFLANLYVGMPISITVEGANILTRNLIIFGQGAVRCHPYILKEIAVITAEKPDTNELDRLLLSHIGYFISNFVRSFGYSITGGKLIFSSIKNKRVRKYHRQICRMSAALALLADASLIILGGSLKRKERISARLGDILSQLYLSSAVLKYFHDQQYPDTDIDYVCWSLGDSLNKIQVAIDELLRNFPKRWVGKLLGWVVFPYGRVYYQPKDNLHRHLVSMMLSPSAFRDRLTKHMYLSKQPSDSGSRLELALQKVPTIDPIWKKYHKAVQAGTLPEYLDIKARIRMAQELGILSAEEAHELDDFEALRSEIIKVNEFTFDFSKVIA